MSKHKRPNGFSYTEINYTGPDAREALHTLLHGREQGIEIVEAYSETARAVGFEVLDDPEEEDE